MNLENLCLVELNAQEKLHTDGGLAIPPTFWAWVAAGLAWDILSSPREHYNAFLRGYNAGI